MKRWPIIPLILALLLALRAEPVWASPWPGDGEALVMADWLFLTFLIFFGAALVAFIFAWRSGLLRDVEDAKYYILTIDEPDYYTPEWAREPGTDSGEQHERGREQPDREEVG